MSKRLNPLALGAAVVVTFALGAAPALADKGGHGSGGGGGTTADASIALNTSTSTFAQIAAPSLGSSVSFTVTYPTSVKTPRVEVLCYQNGALVYGEAGSPGDTFVLGGGGSLWLTAGGSASCTANLYYFTWKAGQPATTYLASTSFDAAG
jgi:hypothetical protein